MWEATNSEADRLAEVYQSQSMSKRLRVHYKNPQPLAPVNLSPPVFPPDDSAAMSRRELLRIDAEFDVLVGPGETALMPKAHPKAKASFSFCRLSSEEMAENKKKKEQQRKKECKKRRLQRKREQQQA